MAQQISCPSCGGPLTIESAYTRFVICQFCGQSLYLRDTGVDLAGKVAKLADYPSRLAIGAQGKMKGRAFEVLGRVRYQYDAGFWDEWFVHFADGQVGWAEEDEGDFTLIFKTKLTSPIPPFEQIRVGSFIALGPDRMFVSEKGQARVLGGEGQLAAVVAAGKAIQYVDGNAGNKAFRIVLDDNGFTLHTGEPLSFSALSVEQRSN
jgi:hypothetical protein